jgi:two-component system nitrate/nitrite response regulator NarL
MLPAKEQNQTHSGKVYPEMTDPVDKPIRVFIFDPYALIRAGLRLILEGGAGIKVVGDAGDSTLALDMIAHQKPDIVLLKLNPTSDPEVDIIPRILETWNQTRIILMVTTDDLQIRAQAIQRGVVGIVSKAQPPQVLLKAIKKVHEGEVWLERSLMAQLLSSMSVAHRPPVVDPEAEQISQLSERERQVIYLIGQGQKNKQIAAQLCIGETTVRHHLTSIFNKLGVSDRLELLVYAHRCGLVKPQGK